MNIYQAKEEIKHSIQAYLMKDEFGRYRISPVNQRPILLIGPPGIGKTAIMEQIARECEIALISYTITHHTRQSAIGLPYILEKEYGDKKYQVTEYTMSEIIGAVYEKIESTGLKEGILFIDEINCVSETLAPMMLQFLQGKTFGNHKVPEGWMIVAAGNPPEYNKSVRDFDIVTLDRVKKIDVQESFEIWKEYAYGRNIHGSILTYLEIKKDHFYVIESTVDGKQFVTARGWEDLSQMIYAYEMLNIPVDEAMIIQYVQHPKLAKDFANYYDLYKKYETAYDIEAILQGQFTESMCSKLKEAMFDEKVSVIGLMVSRLNEAFINALRLDGTVTMLFEELKAYKSMIMESSDNAPSLLEDILSKLQKKLSKKENANQLDQDTRYVLQAVISNIEAYIQKIVVKGIKKEDEAFDLVKMEFNELTLKRQNEIDLTSQMLNNAFAFLNQTFGDSQEIVIFLTELNHDAHALKFIQENGNELYHKYNQSLLFGQRRKSILDDIERYMLVKEI